MGSNYEKGMYKQLMEIMARLRSIINNNSSNSSLPPSTNQKGGKSATTYNGRTKTERKTGGQKGRKGTTLTKAGMEEKIHTFIRQLQR